MATDWAISDIEKKDLPAFLEKAEQLRPTLLWKACSPVRFGTIEQKNVNYEFDIAELSERKLGKGDIVVLDFGEHMAGYFSFQCNCAGSPQDAPAFLKLTFCEIEPELYADTKEYNGWLSCGWFQEEWLHIDLLPMQVKMERRYACRTVCRRFLRMALNGIADCGWVI